jgi:hypothetical protein
MKTYGGVEIYLNSFLTSAPDGGEWSANSLAAVPRGTSLGEPQSRSGHVDEEKKSLPSAKNRTLFVQLVT